MVCKQQRALHLLADPEDVCERDTDDVCIECRIKGSWFDWYPDLEQFTICANCLAYGFGDGCEDGDCGSHTDLAEKDRDKREYFCVRHDENAAQELRDYAKSLAPPQPGPTTMFSTLLTKLNNWWTPGRIELYF